MSQRADSSPLDRPGVGLLRRLLAIAYDLFLLLALWFIFAGLAMALNQGEAIGRDHPYHLIYVFALVLISFFYYAWFWTHGGQTLGMKTWKLKLTTSAGLSLSWQQTLIYFSAAVLSWGCGGLGFFWSLFNRDNATWHDRIAGCKMQDLR